MDNLNSNTPSTTASSSPLNFGFSGNTADYFRIWIVNLGLSIITLGIYSAWAKVRTNQYFYSHTNLAGSSFRYLANPIAILKGRILAFTLFVLYSTASSYAPAFAAVLSILFLIILPWLVTRAMMFRLRNTSYRNIRFNFRKNYSEAVIAFIVLPILIFFTLGLIIPYMIFRQKKFIVNNSAFGKQPFHFHATPAMFYKIYLVIVVTMLVGGVLIAAMNFIPIIGQILTPIFMLVLYTYIAAYFNCETSNYIFNSTELAGNQLYSNMRSFEVFSLYLTNILGILLTLGLLIPWAKIRMARYRAEHIQISANIEIDSFVSSELEKVSATGDEMGEMFDIDLGL